jgi:N-acetylglutamate synthase-like GNAT family acetyltransferase
MNHTFQVGQHVLFTPGAIYSREVQKGTYKVLRQMSVDERSHNQYRVMHLVDTPERVVREDGLQRLPILTMPGSRT